MNPILLLLLMQPPPLCDGDMRESASAHSHAPKHIFLDTRMPQSISFWKRWLSGLEMWHIKFHALPLAVFLAKDIVVCACAHSHATKHLFLEEVAKWLRNVAY